MAEARRTTIWLLAALSASSTAQSQPAAAPTLAAAPAKSEAGAAAASSRECLNARGALAELACELAQALLPRAAGADVTVIALASDTPVPEPLLLRERIRAVVAGALMGNASSSSSAPAARTARSKWRVELSLEVKAGKLGVSADVRRGSGLWQRVRRTAQPVELHAYAARPLDGELRALIPPPPLVVSEIIKVKLPERGVVALGCGDIGADGAQEIALVSRSSVRVGRIVGAAFSELSASAWSALAPVAPAPLREPIASVDITAQGALRVGSSDRRDGLALDAQLSVLERWPGLLPVPGGGCAARSGLSYAGLVVGCTQGEQREAQDLGAPVDAWGGARSELAAAWNMGRDFAERTLRVRRGAQSFTWPSRVGAQLALGDADGDGAPELAYSLDTLDPARDGVQLASLSAKGGLKKRFEFGVPGVQALGICQAREGRGMAPLLVATAEELWLVR